VIKIVICHPGKTWKERKKDRDSIRLISYVRRTKLDHLTKDIRGVIDVWCKIQLVARTLPISSLCLEYGRPLVQWDCNSCTRLKKLNKFRPRGNCDRESLKLYFSFGKGPGQHTIGGLKIKNVKTKENLVIMPLTGPILHSRNFKLSPNLQARICKLYPVAGFRLDLLELFR